MGQLHAAYAASQTAWAKCKNKLQEEWLNHCRTKKSLTHELNSHMNTEKILSCCWQTMKKFDDFIDYINDLLNDKSKNENVKEQFRLSDLMLEIKFQKQIIDNLKKKVQGMKDQWNLDVTALKQQLQNRASDHEMMIKVKKTQIVKLEQTLQQNLNHNSVYLMNTRKRHRAQRGNEIVKECWELILLCGLAGLTMSR